MPRQTFCPGTDFRNSRVYASATTLASVDIACTPSLACTKGRRRYGFGSCVITRGVYKFTFSLYWRFDESIDWINAVAWPINMAKQTAPETIEIMVNQRSTIVFGGCCPYPMHNICDIALNKAHEYCSYQADVWTPIFLVRYLCGFYPVLTVKLSIATHESSGKLSNIGTMNWRHPFQWPMSIIKQIKLKMRTAATEDILRCSRRNQDK